VCDDSDDSDDSDDKMRILFHVVITVITCFEMMTADDDRLAPAWE
jgi:hypothetical protein